MWLEEMQKQQAREQGWICEDTSVWIMGIEESVGAGTAPEVSMRDLGKPRDAGLKSTDAIQVLGDVFQDKDNQTFSQADRFTKEFIGIYFSAHWCPPCRDFTPKLAQSYSEGLRDKMEIVFVSSDRDERAFWRLWRSLHQWVQMSQQSW